MCPVKLCSGCWRASSSLHWGQWELTKGTERMCWVGNRLLERCCKALAASHENRDCRTHSICLPQFYGSNTAHQPHTMHLTDFFSHKISRLRSRSALSNLLHDPILVGVNVQSEDLVQPLACLRKGDRRVPTYLSGFMSIVIMESSPTTLWFWGRSFFAKLVSSVDPLSVIFLPASFCIHDSLELPSAELIPGTTRGILAANVLVISLR